MKRHLWQGEMISDDELKLRAARMNSFILKGHETLFQIDEFFRAGDRFAKRLATNLKLRQSLIDVLVDSGESNTQDAETCLDEITSFINEKALRSKMNSEFGNDNPFRSQKVLKDRPVFESWFPLGFLVQILASNSPSLAVLSAFEGLMTGNINFIKLSSSSSDFTTRFFEEYFTDPIAKKWQELLIVARVTSREKALLSLVMNEADGVVAWGSEESLIEIRKMTPARARLIEWGHRISFSYVTQNKLKDSKIYDLIARDVFLFDQQSCSSPQCLFIEDSTFYKLEEFAQSLEAAFERQSKEQLKNPSALEAAEITKTVLVTKTESALHQNYTKVIEANHWRILIDSRPGLRASPLYRTLWIKPIERRNLLSVLRPLSQYLQTVGLSCERDELFELKQIFFKAGATRIRPVGEMLDSYAGEPHDGVSALTRYMKKVSLEQHCGLDQYATLDDLRLNEINHVNLPKKLMNKEDFQNMIPPIDSEELFFKSGGSSGEPKISVFTYLDYHRQMRFAADGLLAAGLDPAHDRCMNLFFSGGLYGSFLSIFSVLEDLKAVQFPMTAHMDFDLVAKIISTKKVNVLMGMPSYILQLLESQTQQFKKEKLIKKIYFGGEAFSKKQIERLKDEFGIESIISATYGSVDMGPLGYQCEFSEPGVHHLHQNLHHLEIIELDTDSPVTNDAPGRLIFTSYGRQGLNLLRYDIGDLGRWKNGKCECGRLSPRFELLGRHGDIFRAAGAFLNYNKFVQLMSNELSYAHEIQLTIEREQNFDCIRILIDSASSIEPGRVQKMFLSQYAELNDLVSKEKSVFIKVSTGDSSQFIRSASSGKLLRIIDQRET